MSCKWTVISSFSKYVSQKRGVRGQAQELGRELLHELRGEGDDLVLELGDDPLHRHRELLAPRTAAFFPFIALLTSTSVFEFRCSFSLSFNVI